MSPGKVPRTAETQREEVDLLIDGIDWLVTVDKTRRVVRNAGVAIRDGRFVMVGGADEISRRVVARQRLDGSGTVATPGFVDGHLHSSFQLSRGLADEVNAKAFLFDRMYPYEGALTEEDVFDSARLAAWELLRHGVTCFVDPGNYFPSATVRACREIGIRVIAAASTFDQATSVLGLLPESMIDSTASAVDRTEDFLEEFGGPIERGYSASASFRGLNNSSDELIVKLRNLADQHDTFVQCHACFSYSTRDASVSQHGIGEIERLDRLGVLDERMLLIHAGWISPGGFAAITDRRPSLVAAPSSSFHSGYGNFEVGLMPELLALGVNVALGSDHASSGSVDMCREMYLAACGYKETRIDAAIMPPETVLEMATIHGARAVRAADDLGSIEVGKLADIVLFDATAPEWLPLFNPVANLVYSAPGSTVRSVVVGGEPVVDNGHLVKVDERGVRDSAAKAVSRLTGRLDIDGFVALRWPVVGG
ncbi:MAG TPA: amidohydrolase family protein [Acidimicrobiia bacterium]|nr:amidohydrolase family protein [Acidimicrobiia bacterium]